MMKMKLDLVLNYNCFIYSMKMTRTKGLRNSKNQISRLNQRFH